MTARRLALAWCWGSVCGLVVGWVYGSHVQRLTEAHRLAEDYQRNEGAAMSAERRALLMAYRPATAAVRVPEPREGAGTSATEAGNGAQRCGLFDPAGRNRCSLSRGHDGLHRNPEAHDVPWPTQPGWVDLFGIERNRAERGIPSQRDDEPCPQYSPGGGIPCSVTGTHTAHIFLGSCAPDAKDDADERIE